MSITAAGIDGCRTGWVAAVTHGPLSLPAAGTELVLLSPNQAISGFLSSLSDAVVAIDMPMGLPARAGFRECDRLARALLGPRRASIFPALDRELLGLDFTAARDLVLGRRAENPGAGPAENPVMTHQALNLGPKIAVIDALLRSAPERQRCISESHPELSFRTLARSLNAPPLASKRTAEGRRARLELLSFVFPDCRMQVAAALWPRSHVAVDDLLDAYAVLWSAIRYGRGEALTLGGERDAYGLRQQLIV